MELENVTIQVIKSLEIQAGDTIVFSFPGRLTAPATERILAGLKEILPTEVHVILLDDGASCEGVLRMGEVRDAS